MATPWSGGSRGSKEKGGITTPIVLPQKLERSGRGSKASRKRSPSTGNHPGGGRKGRDRWGESPHLRKSNREKKPKYRGRKNYVNFQKAGGKRKKKGKKVNIDRA